MIWGFPLVSQWWTVIVRKYEQTSLHFQIVKCCFPSLEMCHHYHYYTLYFIICPVYRGSSWQSPQHNDMQKAQKRAFSRKRPNVQCENNLIEEGTITTITMPCTFSLCLWHYTEFKEKANSSHPDLEFSINLLCYCEINHTHQLLQYPK